jgi:hypothetical protein
VPEFAPQASPLWLAYRDGDTVWAAGWHGAPSDDSGVLETWVAVEGHHGGAVGAVPVRSSGDRYLAGSRTDAESTARPPRGPGPPAGTSGARTAHSASVVSEG